MVSKIQAHGPYLTYADYEVLRSSRGDDDFDAPHPRVNIDTLLRICNAKLPPLPDTLDVHPLPPDISVPEPQILRYLSTFVDEFPMTHLDDVRPRCWKLLQMELTLMLF